MNTPRRRGSGAQQMETLLNAARIFTAITAESLAQVGEGVTVPQLRVLVLASQPGHLNATGRRRGPRRPPILREPHLRSIGPGRTA